jgi:hypothetical protein
MRTEGRGWIAALSTNDDQVIWAKLHKVVSRHSAVRMLYASDGFSGEGLKDLFCDLTQELFLKLHQKDRWRCYLDDGYTDEEVDQELYRIEVPNLVSHLQRERYPESYRIARRISDLLQGCPEFQSFSRSVYGPGTPGRQRASSRMSLKVYGLSAWPSDKVVKPGSGLPELIKDVAFRLRDTRRTGRGSGSQVIISNEELKQLIFDIFEATDTPTDIRTMRSLVMSKLAVEDCRLVSIHVTSTTANAAHESLSVDLPDERPTPLDVLLQKETVRLVDRVIDELFDRMRETVNDRPRRFKKLVEVAWHCYFNLASPSQSSIARMMGISDSLVSHYRKIFDTLIQSLTLNLEELILLNGALERRLTSVVMSARSSEANHELGAIVSRRRRPRAPSCGDPAKAFAEASAGHAMAIDG